jgi:Lipocalin-like domain
LKLGFGTANIARPRTVRTLEQQHGTAAAIVRETTEDTMNRRHILAGSAVIASLVVLPGSAPAQQKSMKDLLVGTWTLLISDGIKDDGTQVPGFGPNPDGMLIFTPDGHFSLQVIRSGRAPFASKNRMTGTADENRTVVQGMFTAFGTYTVDEAGKAISQRMTASSFPNFDSTVQKLLVTALTDEVLTFNVPTPSAAGYVRLENAWKKAK